MEEFGPRSRASVSSQGTSVAAETPRRGTWRPLREREERNQEQASSTSYARPVSSSWRAALTQTTSETRSS